MTKTKAAKQVETLVEDAQKTAAASMDKMNKSLEEATAFAQANMDAFINASETAAKAAETMNAEIVAFAKKSVEDGVAASKDMAEVKTIPEFVERQSAVMKSMFDEFAAQATKLGELSNAAMKDVYAPITARAEAAADFAKTLRA